MISRGLLLPSWVISHHRSTKLFIQFWHVFSDFEIATLFEAETECLENHFSGCPDFSNASKEITIFYTELKHMFLYAMVLAYLAVLQKIKQGRSISNNRTVETLYPTHWHK